MKRTPAPKRRRESRASARAHLQTHTSTHTLMAADLSRPDPEKHDSKRLTAWGYFFECSKDKNKNKKTNKHHRVWQRETPRPCLPLLHRLYKTVKAEVDLWQVLLAWSLTCCLDQHIKITRLSDAAVLKYPNHSKAQNWHLCSAVCWLSRWYLFESLTKHAPNRPDVFAVWIISTLGVLILKKSDFIPLEALLYLPAKYTPMF